MNSSSFVVVSWMLCFYSFALLRTSLSEGNKLFCSFRLYFFRFVVFAFVLVLTLSLRLMLFALIAFTPWCIYEEHSYSFLSLSLTRLSVGFYSSVHCLLKTNNFFLFHLWFIILGRVWQDDGIPNQILLMPCGIKSILCFLKMNLVYLSKLIFGWKNNKYCISRWWSLCSLNAQMYEVFSGCAVVHNTIHIWHICSSSAKFDKYSFAIFGECGFGSDLLWFVCISWTTAGNAQLEPQKELCFI